MSAATATYRVNYSDYMADITGNPKQIIKSVNSNIAQVNNRQNQGIQQTGVMPHYGGGAEKCARCSKNVYLAEKKVGAGRSFHSSCFSCETCNRKLDATNLSEHKGEIYCKTCYTRQFGVHGLVSGVSMTTEQPLREARHSRRSSYGSDLDAPVITHKQTRPRAHSNDNALRGEHSATQNDELPKMFPWRNDVLPEQRSPPTNKPNNGLDILVDKEYQRPASQIGFGKLIESTSNGRRSTDSNEDDREKDVFESERKSYTNGTSAIINMPVVSPPKRLDSKIERIEMPTASTKHDQRSRSPSPTSADVYRRQTSREGHTDISDNFSRLTLDEKQTNKNYFNDNSTTHTIASENPLIKQTYSHSSSYEIKQITPTIEHFDREQNHSRDPSPSSTSGYTSSSVHGEGIMRDSTSPPSAHVPEHDYLNPRSSNVSTLDRRPSSSPGENEKRSSTVTDFVSKTNNFPSPSTTGKYSTIAALIKPHRPLSQTNNGNDDDLGN